MWTLLTVGLALALSVAPSGAAQNNTATITVDYSNGGMTVTINSTKGISHITIFDCEGVSHTHEYSDEDEAEQLVHTETFVIASVTVKSGVTEQNFPNPDAEACEGGASECEGPATVSATAHDDPMRNEVSWDAVGSATGYNVYRAQGAGSMVLLTTTTDTNITDDAVTNGVTYRYNVTAIIDGVETESCDTAQVTAIPDLPGLFAAAMAAVGGVAAYGLLRRRKA